MKDKNQIDIIDVFVIHEWYYKIGGVWPLRKSYIKYGIFLLYSVTIISMSYIDMITVFGNLHLMVENLLETLVTTAAIFMVVVVRFHPSLIDLIVTVKNEIALNDYRSNEERYLYYAYNRIAYSISKIAITLSVITIMGMYLKPLTIALPAIFKSLGRNGTTLNEDVLVIPFKGMQFLHITDLRIYCFVCICQLSFLYLGVCHTVTICFVLSLVLHVCGKLSVLKARVETLETTTKDEFETAIRGHVQAHIKLINSWILARPSVYLVLFVISWIDFINFIRLKLRSHSMVKAIENIFQYILLFDLVQTSIRLGLSAYVALTSKDAGSEFMAMCTFASYASVLFVLLYAYCFTGEYLTQESKSLTETYYHCNWQEMPVSCKSSLMICMICSQNPLAFTAGKFYKFSLYGYTGIVKTSMAYLSMLRTIV